MKRQVFLLCVLALVLDSCALEVRITTPADGQVVNTLKMQLNASVSGGSPPYDFLWFSDVDGRIFPNAHGTPYFELWFPTVGRHRMTIEVKDSRGAVAKDTITMTIKPALYATMVSPANGTVYGAVRFTAGISGTPPYAAEWSSDRDGFLGDSLNFSKLLSAGVHRITLKVVDMTSAIAYGSALIDVRYAPKAAIKSPTLDTIYGPVVFACTVAGGQPPYKVEWSSDLDGVIGDSTNFSKQLSIGEHKITLQVRDAKGTITVVDRKLIVRAPLTARIISPAEGTYRGIIGFDSNYSGGNPPYEVMWLSSISGFFGNGGSITKELEEGNHKITLRVVDRDGIIAEDNVSLDILPQSYMQYAIIVFVIIIAVFIIIRLRGWRK